MDRNINNKDFEQFVKQNADQYRMYPSEKVWKGIYSNLHTRRTWYGVGFVLLLMTSVVVTWVMISSPATKQPGRVENTISTGKQNEPVSEDKTPTKEFTGVITPDNNLTGSLNANTSGKLITLLPETLGDFGSLTSATPIKNVFTNSSFNDFLNNETSSKTSLNVSIKDQMKSNESYLIQLDKKETFTSKTPGIMIQNVLYPLSTERANNYIKSFAKNKKINWQLFLTPTISYRRLSENKSFLRNISFANPAYSYAFLYNVNSVVTHKPDMGLELGLNAGYPVTKNLKIRGGVQFNINRYAIKAFSSNNQIATIALNTNSRNDSVNTWTSYRNFNGTGSDWLQNYYFSVSAPIGVELKLSGNNKTHVGIAGTIQPTYIISDRAYLISTDYKNYVEVPWLIRRWNMNTGFEAFVSYSSNKFTWQVGPQVRYQLLSSFQNKYPVKENLFDFGLKLGIMLNK